MDKIKVRKMNKIIKTKVGDEIHYFVNGQENHGVVAKMSATYVTIFKEDGKFYQVPLDDTFFVKDILVNKTWDDMSMEERTEQLQKIKAYSPRYLSKSWEQLPKELQEVLQKAGEPVKMPESEHYKQTQHIGQKSPSSPQSFPLQSEEARRTGTRITDKPEVKAPKTGQAPTGVN